MNASKDLMTAILIMLTAKRMMSHTPVPVTVDTRETGQAASHNTQEARLVTFLSKYQDKLFSKKNNAIYMLVSR